MLPQGHQAPHGPCWQGGQTAYSAKRIHSFAEQLAQERPSVASKRCVQPELYACSSARRRSPVSSGVLVLLDPWVSRL